MAEFDIMTALTQIMNNQMALMSTILCQRKKDELNGPETKLTRGLETCMQNTMNLMFPVKHVGD